MPICFGLLWLCLVWSTIKYEQLVYNVAIINDQRLPSTFYSSHSHGKWKNLLVASQNLNINLRGFSLACSNPQNEKYFLAQKQMACRKSRQEAHWLGVSVIKMQSHVPCSHLRSDGRISTSLSQSPRLRRHPKRANRTGWSEPGSSACPGPKVEPLPVLEPLIVPKRAAGAVTQGPT